MSRGYAKVTGRVVGPEGLGRMGSVQFIPKSRYKALLEGGGLALVAHWAVGRLDADGTLMDMAGTPWLMVAAPEALPEKETNYVVVLDVPGDQGGAYRWEVRLLAGTTVDLVDLIEGKGGAKPADPSDSKGRVRDIGQGILEAVKSVDVVHIGGGLLAWRAGIDD